MSSFTEKLEYEPTDLISVYGLPVFRVTKEFKYRVGSLEDPLLTFLVPVGFLTDLASIPQWLHWLFKPDGKWVKAAVIHDYLYSNSYIYPMSRVLKDSIFLEGMTVLQVHPLLSHVFFILVRAFGAKYYSSTS